VINRRRLIDEAAIAGHGIRPMLGGARSARTRRGMSCPHQGPLDIAMDILARRDVRAADDARQDELADVILRGGVKAPLASRRGAACASARRGHLTNHRLRRATRACCGAASHRRHRPGPYLSGSAHRRERRADDCQRAQAARTRSALDGPARCQQLPLAGRPP